MRGSFGSFTLNSRSRGLDREREVGKGTQCAGFTSASSGRRMPFERLASTSGRTCGARGLGRQRGQGSYPTRARAPSTRAYAGSRASHRASLCDLGSVVEAQQFDRGMLEELFEETRRMERIVDRGEESRILAGRVMGTLFYEPSTRTRLSFETAMCRLGGKVVSTENAREFSSVAKGETLQDTIRTLEQYVDVVVLRHYLAGSAKAAAEAASVPLINAGDGPGQHPTQALLDIYTIVKEIGRVDRTSVALVGDLANGRTARSLAYMLSKFQGVKLYFVAPKVARMNDDIKSYLDKCGVAWEESEDLKAVARGVDVLYQTRIQKERYGDRPEDYEKAKGKYVVDAGLMEVMKKDAVVMHPLPRVGEISPEVDSDPRAAYFRQTKNGLYIRMALLSILLGKEL